MSAMPMTVRATECTDPAAYYMPAPVLETAPLSNMVYVGEGPTLPDEDIDLLAALVYHEAGNQDLHGKRLVVDVVFNRVRDPKWPDTIQGVLFQTNPQQFTTKEVLEAYYTDMITNHPDIAAECYQAIREETDDQLDFEIEYFNNGPVSGTFAYKYGGHYFGY